MVHRSIPADHPESGRAFRTRSAQPPTDIQAAITVIGRRTVDHDIDVLNLARTCLAKADLEESALASAHLSGANLAEAALVRANLSGANLRGVRNLVDHLARP
ncbi:pentapeptide repeat-containing protein [Amycolatopsis sp. lyj-90]|uniref:pentapeptide repeat-containing protein n=1 Tax=Amycolatopsis sp. lyj-90 TaxID=2789285 RepID=UPI00397C8BAE